MLHGSLRIGEMPPELHMRVGSVPDGAPIKLPALRGKAMLLHSKGLASLGSFTPNLATMFPMGARRRQSATNAAIERARRRHARGEEEG